MKVIESTDNMQSYLLGSIQHYVTRAANNGAESLS